MATSFYDLSVGTYTQLLRGAVGTLEKTKAYCAEQGIATSDILKTSLIDDMWDFHMQVISFNHHSAKTIEALTSGEFVPPLGYEPRDYDGLLEMTKASLVVMESQESETINSTAGNTIVFKLGPNEMPFTAENFVSSFSLPNFYFHLTTAYDILRMKGVPIGKMDFIGKLKIGV
jgi:hypothetical protein